MTNDRTYQRKTINLSELPLKFKFYKDNEDLNIEGKVYDISRHGLCVMTNEKNKTIDPKDIGNIIVYKSAKSIELPVICKWRKALYTLTFYGFETDDNLYQTELKHYLI